MRNIIDGLESILSVYGPLLQMLDEEKTAFKPSKNKWSKKEIIGHLVDSAQNNIRRFVVGQYEEQPNIRYAQDHWVIAAGYQERDLSEVIQLFILLNKHLVRVLKNLPPGMESRKVMTGALHSIQWLAEDYNKHVLHHLHQVLELDDVPYP